MTWTLYLCIAAVMYILVSVETIHDTYVKGLPAVGAISYIVLAIVALFWPALLIARIVSQLGEIYRGTKANA